MEDIDLELKKVQLARERLALEKETARRNLKAKTVGQLASAGSALRSVGRMMVMPPIAAFVALLNFVSKHWKNPALVLFCLVGFGGGFLLVQKHLDESDRRAQELYAEKLQECCITEQIPLPTCKERAPEVGFPQWSRWCETPRLRT